MWYTVQVLSQIYLYMYGTAQLKLDICTHVSRVAQKLSRDTVELHKSNVHAFHMHTTYFLAHEQ